MIYIEVKPLSTGNFKAYHMLMLPDKAISEDSFFWGSGGLPHSRRMRSCFRYMMITVDPELFART